MSCCGFPSMLPLALFFEPHTVRGWLETGGYGALFGLLISCGLGMPIPEDVPLIAAGILIARHRLYWIIAAPLAWLGIIGGDCILYTIGYFYGEKIGNIPFIGKHVTLKRIQRAETLFRHYGIWMVAIGRLFMGIRGAMVVTAGTSKFKFVKFIIADGIAAIFSGGMFMVLGYYGGKYGGDIGRRVRNFRYSMWTAAGFLAIVLTIYFFWRDRKRAEATIGAPDK
jgi:membrane protein DedA with SNARE-associated domain